MPSTSCRTVRPARQLHVPPVATRRGCSAAAHCRYSKGRISERCTPRCDASLADAGPTFRPTQAFNAYRSLYSGRILLGVEVPPEAWGGHVTSEAEVGATAAPRRGTRPPC